MSQIVNNHFGIPNLSALFSPQSIIDPSLSKPITSSITIIEKHLQSYKSLINDLNELLKKGNILFGAQKQIKDLEMEKIAYTPDRVLVFIQNEIDKTLKDLKALSFEKAFLELTSSFDTNQNQIKSLNDAIDFYLKSEQEGLEFKDSSLKDSMPDNLEKLKKSLKKIKMKKTVSTAKYYLATFSISLEEIKKLDHFNFSINDELQKRSMLRKFLKNQASIFSTLELIQISFLNISETIKYLKNLHDEYKKLTDKKNFDGLDIEYKELVVCYNKFMFILENFKADSFKKVKDILKTNQEILEKWHAEIENNKILPKPHPFSISSFVKDPTDFAKLQETLQYTCGCEDTASLDLESLNDSLLKELDDIMATIKYEINLIDEIYDILPSKYLEIAR